MAIRCPYLVAELATARQFLKQPAKVGVSPVPKLREEPFGEGSTSRVFSGI